MSSPSILKEMKRKKVLQITALVLLFSIIFIILGGMTAYFAITKDTRLEVEKLNTSGANLLLFDSEGTPLAYTSAVKRYSEYDEISPYVVKAFIALEDKRFLKHNGIDYYRLAGAMINNLKAGYLKEGGSTITQQLAKNALLSNEKTLTRKLKEAKLAFQLERRFSKEEIITMYLNTIYFGNGLYGITAASERLFGKLPADLTLAESAMLAGIVKNPRDNSPLGSVERAIERRNLVLSVMKREGAIDETAYQNAVSTGYVQPASLPKSSNSYQNAVFYEAGQLLDMSEKEILTGNLKIYTYCDQALQVRLEHAVEDEDFKVSDADVAVMVGDNATGGIAAYAATFSYAPQTVYRSPASTIKPLISYLPALDLGRIAPASPVSDQKTDFGGYAPDNFGGKYLGETDIRAAVKSSSNVVAVRLLQEIGVEYGKMMLDEMGIPTDDRDGLALALGGMYRGVTIGQLLGGYLCLSNGGNFLAPGLIRRIEREDGTVLYQRNEGKKPLFSAESSYLMTDMLCETAQSGTAKKLSSLPYPVAAKTGTAGSSAGNTDAWCAAYTAERTVISWYGNLSGESRSMLPNRVTGGGLPTLLTRYAFECSDAPHDFAVPIGIIEGEIDTKATQTEQKLLLSSDLTPERYRKRDLFDIAFFPPEVSHYWDDLLSGEFKAEEIAEGISIRFDTKPGIRYDLIDAQSDTRLFTVQGNGESVEFITPPKFGFNGYYLRLYDENGEHLTDSQPIYLLSLNPLTLRRRA